MSIIKIKIEINYNKIIEIFLKPLILKRAYLGYCEYVKRGEQTPLKFKDFSNFDMWKIRLSFKMYFCYFKGSDFAKYEKPFLRSVLFNF